MRINKHDTQGTKPLLGKGELGYDDYVAGGDVGRVYVGTGSENIALAERLESNMVTKAQFNALADERKANRAGSGFDEWGKHAIPSSTTLVINEGMWVTNVDSNIIVIGRSRTYGNVGLSKSYFPIININGYTHKLASNLDQTIISLPTAPNIYPYDTVLTTEQIASGVIKHADSSNSGLIVNGKFDTDTSGWKALWNCTVAQSLGKLVATSTVSSGYMDYNSIAFPTITGKEYIVEVDMANISATNITAYIRTGSDYGTVITISAQKTFKFIATTTTTNIAFRSYVTAIGQQSSVDNVGIYPADAISRSDLVFLESFHEDISEKNFIYPLGNVQYLGGNTDGLTGVTNGNFTGFETYSLFGNWQTPSTLIGKGYIWSNLTEAQKRAFIANPENNCYLDGDKTIQVRYRVRVVQGVGDKWGNVDSTNPSPNASIGALTFGNSLYPNAKGKKVVISSDVYASGVTGNTFYNKGNNTSGANTDLGAFVSDFTGLLSYDGKCFALPIALVHRKNLGMYHPVYNPNGSKKASDGNFWYNTAVSFTSISDCFDPAKVLTASGYIGSVSGRPDELFYDQVHESDILDLRNSSKKPEDYNRLISREFNKLVVGSVRGKEGEFELRPYASLDTDGTVSNTIYTNGIISTVKVGDIVTIIGINNSGVVRTYKDIVTEIGASRITLKNAVTRSNGTYYLASASTRTKSNTLLHCDIIGNPTNYPTSWKQNGIFGTPLIVAEDGTSLLPDGVRDTFKLSRKANAAPILCLRSTDSGTTWTSFTPTFSTTTNEITLTDEPAGNLVMVYYQTHTSMAVPVANSEVLGIGEVLANAFSGNSHMVATLIGKIPIAPYAGSTKSTEKVGHVFGYASTSGFDFIEDPSSGQRVSHNPISLANGNPAVKVFPYLTRLNGKAYLNLVFKEMKYNGTSWGDNDKFNIVNNVSTTTDNNAQTVLIGQKTVELPYFIAGDE